MIAAAIFFVLGGLSRVMDGTGKVPGSLAAMAVLAFASAMWGVGFSDGGHLMAVVFSAACATVSLQRGFVDWTNSAVNRYQYLPALAGALPAAVITGNLAFVPLYAACLLCAGLADPAFARLDAWLKARSLGSIQAHRYGEFFAGALVIGPLTLL